MAVIPVTQSRMIRTVKPPMGGRNTLRSGRVMSSGYMPFVSWNKHWRSVPSSQPKRSATPGKYHTGSTAACTAHHSHTISAKATRQAQSEHRLTLVTLHWPDANKTVPSDFTRPLATACINSGSSMWALVTGKQQWQRMTSKWQSGHQRPTACTHQQSLGEYRNPS